MIFVSFNEDKVCVCISQLENFVRQHTNNKIINELECYWILMKRIKWRVVPISNALRKYSTPPKNIMFGCCCYCCCFATVTAVIIVVAFIFNRLTGWLVSLFVLLYFNSFHFIVFFAASSSVLICLMRFARLHSLCQLQIEYVFVIALHSAYCAHFSACWISVKCTMNMRKNWK